MCRPETVECETCVFVETCAPASAARREALYAKFGVMPKEAKPRKLVPAKIVEPVLVSTKVAVLIKRIERAGLAVTDSLRQGVNPFTKPIFLRIACHLLLRLPEGFSRETLVAAFISKLGWDRDTALAQSTYAIETLTALGAADLTNDRLILRK